VESNATTCKSRDILSSRWRVFILYWLPAIAIIVAGTPAISSGWRTVVWTVALATMGRGVYCECGPLWARALLSHRPLLPPNGRRRIVVRSRHPASWGERLEPAWPNNPDRRRHPVVPARDVFGEILATKLTANCRSPRRPIFGMDRPLGSNPPLA